MDHGFPIKTEIKPILNTWAWQRKKTPPEPKIWDMWELIGQHSQYMFVAAPPFFVTRMQSTVSKNPSIYNIIRWFAGPMGQMTY